MDFNLEEYKKYLIPMLEAFHNFCQKHNLRYSVAAGTMLGAIRHKGMIPWDDDIDVFMPRPDYDKFLELTAQNYITNYKVISIQTDPNYYLPFAKIFDIRTKLIEYEHCSDCTIGVFMDIFPIDGMPSNKDKREKNYSKYQSTLYKAFLSRFKYKSNIGFKLYLKNLFYRNFKSQKFYTECDKIASKYKFNESDEVRLYCSIYGDKEILSRNIFNEYITIDFESIKVNCIKEYDYYLTKVYGDYMQLPPIEKRISHHSHYWIEI